MISEKNGAPHGRAFPVKIAAAVLLTGSLFFTVSCGASKAPDEGYLLAEPDGGDYSYSYPEDWTVLRSDGMFAVGASDGLANISSAGYTLSLKDCDLSRYQGDDAYAQLLDDYLNGENGFEGYIAQLKANFGDNIVFDGENAVTIAEDGAGCAAKKITYHMKVGEAEDAYYFETALILLPYDRSRCSLYVLTFTALGEDAYNAHKAVFDKAVSSFAFSELF